jgi:hypothetical protein
VIALLIATVAFAQETPEENAAGDIVIRGLVQKPEITVVIVRENLNRDYELDLRESFLDRIPEAVSRPPF